MYLFPFYLIYAPFLLVMAAGVAMYIWGLNAHAQGKELAKIFGLIIVIFSILVMVYNTYVGFKPCGKYCPTKMVNEQAEVKH